MIMRAAITTRHGVTMRPIKLAAPPPQMRPSILHVTLMYRIFYNKRNKNMRIPLHCTNQRVSIQSQLQHFAARILGAQLVPSEKSTQQEHRCQTAEIDENNVRSGHAIVQPTEFEVRFFVKVNPKIKASEKYAALECKVGIKKNRTAAGADIARECTWR
jgi:hypothetical protein